MPLQHQLKLQFHTKQRRGIPFDRALVEAVVRGISVVAYSDGALARKIEAVWDNFLKA